MTVKSHTKTVKTSRASTTHSSFLKFSEADYTFPYRIVGSYEYGKALTHLGDLVESSTPEQIGVYDKLIQSRPEYSFHSGVVMKLGLDAKLSSSTSPNGDLAGTQYLKHSLAWMMALARVELGATMSMYAKTDDPFGDAVRVGGQEFGAEEFLRILLDDLAAHLKSAQIDPDYQRGLGLKEKVDETSLADLRRTQLIGDMLEKVQSSGDTKIIAQTEPYAKMTENAVGQLLLKIAAATTRVSVSTGVSTSTSTEEHWSMRRRKIKN